MNNTGKNMFDLRVSNRMAVLRLLYPNGGISRKELAARLNLTPAAISNIVSDMIREGILVETSTVEGSSRMGRREVLLAIDCAKFKVLCVYIPTRDIHISCIDMCGNTHFSKGLKFSDSLNGEQVLSGICDELLAYVNSLSPEERQWIIGVGVGVKGIYDEERGVSVNSFGLWEEELPLRGIMEKRLGIKILADNNIRCVASAEILFGGGSDTRSMLFVKYGPLIGGAFILQGELFRGSNYQAMEFGHFIVDPLGTICRCGKRGCLETVAGFDVIASHLMTHYSERRMPILYRLTKGNPSNIDMDLIMRSFDEDEKIVREIMDSVLDRFVFALVNVVELINPQQVILYGYPFESEGLMRLLFNKIKRVTPGKNTAQICRSPHNLMLDNLGCASIVIKDFISNGGIYTAPGAAENQPVVE